MNKISNKLKQFAFYWLTSFAIAIVGYYLLWIIMPNHWVFGSWFRMFKYHWQHPIQYIAIPCFFYGIFATIFSSKFLKLKSIRRIILTLIIAILVIIISSPFGGMLWHYHDMQAGYFPQNWFFKILKLGFSGGLTMGWLIVGLSVPYNILGVVVAYFLTRKGALIFQDLPPEGEKNSH
ncbi:MAG: hypothetical protein GX879_06105 [Bacteroidales bacterium]|nr:hypothetical protein [Bacteroidales bacterium]